LLYQLSYAPTLFQFTLTSHILHLGEFGGSSAIGTIANLADLFVRKKHRRGDASSTKLYNLTPNAAIEAPPSE
jgi:hypothetical protein